MDAVGRRRHACGQYIGRGPHACPTVSLTCHRGHLWADNAQYTRTGRRHHCRACRLEAHPARIRGRWDAPTCQRGHLKTLADWRTNKRGQHYCRPCTNARHRAYRAAA